MSSNKNRKTTIEEKELKHQFLKATNQLEKLGYKIETHYFQEDNFENFEPYVDPEIEALQRQIEAEFQPTEKDILNEIPDTPENIEEEKKITEYEENKYISEKILPKAKLNRGSIIIIRKGAVLLIGKFIKIKTQGRNFGHFQNNK